MPVIVYVIAALLKKARIGGIFATNCDSDVSNPPRIGYIRYHWTVIGCSNVHVPVTQVVYVTDAKVSSWHYPESNMECFWYNYTIINCLLMTYAQLLCTSNILYTYVSKCCESH